jgi:hypothetical protein
MPDYLHTTSHDFKSNFSRYLQTLLKGEYDGILVKHYKKPIGVFALLDPPPKQPDPAPEEEEIDMAALIKHLKTLN